MSEAEPTRTAPADMPAEPAADEPFGPERRALTIGLLLTVAATAFEALAVATVLPTAVTQLGGQMLYGWAFSAFMLTNLVGISLAGRSADGAGPGPAFAAGVAAFVGGLLVAGTASSMLVLILGRAIQGAGAGAIAAMAYAVVGRAYGPSGKPRVLAALSTAWVVPGLLGPAIAGLITDHVGWPWVFLGIVPLVLTGGGLALIPLRRLGPAFDTNPALVEPGKASTLLPSLALALGATLLLVGLEAHQSWLVASLAALGLALGVPAFARLTPDGTLRARAGLPAAVAAIGALCFAFFTAEAFVPLALTDLRGQSASVAGLPLSAGTLTWTIGAWVPARYAARRSRRGLVGLGLTLVLLGIAGTTVFLSPGLPLWLGVAAWAVTALGMGIGHTTASLAILELAPPGKSGAASAALQLSSTLAIALGTGLGGAVVATAAARGLGGQVGIGCAFALAGLGAGIGLLAARGLPAALPDGSPPAKLGVT